MGMAASTVHVGAVGTARLRHNTTTNSRSRATQEDTMQQATTQEGEGIIRVDITQEATTQWGITRQLGTTNDHSTSSTSSTRCPTTTSRSRRIRRHRGMSN